MTEAGLLLVLVSPSGGGKGTILKEVLKASKNTFLSISATTRAPRPGEEEGKHYYFITQERFLEMAGNGEMLECAEYAGNGYGTPSAPVYERLERGENVILEIELQGARQIKAICPQAVTLFILPPSKEILKKRLEDRKTEDAETIAKRMKIAFNDELPFAYDCDYVVVNRTVEEAVEETLAIITAARCRREAAKPLIDAVISGERV